MRRYVPFAAVAAVLVMAALAVPALGVLPPGSQGTVYECVSSNHTFTHVAVGSPLACPSQQPVSWPVTAGGTPSPSPSPTTASPSPSPTTASPSPSPTSTSTGGSACVVPLGQNCGAYSYPGIPMSNGFDTYIANQDVGANSGTTETVNATDPGNWSVTADALPLGYTGVQMFPDVQQLTNDWCGAGWGGCQSPGNTPLDSLSKLTVTYAESSPQGPNDIYEFAPDVWSANYPSDVMFWADTHGRCDQGAFGSTVLGSAVLGGQSWTVHRYGGPGAEIIFVLDGPGGPGTCAQQSAGSIDIKGGFDWLTAGGFVTGPEVVTQLNTGWEITSADNATFTMSSYGIQAAT